MKAIGVWIILLALSVPAAGAPTAADWLMKINHAAGELDYTGTFVYVHDGYVATMEVSQRVRDGAARQRIYSLNGAPREVIRDDTQVWCYAPDQKRGVHEYRQVSKQGFPNLLPGTLDHLVRYYDVYTGNTGRIADRSAQQIMVVPKDELRYGYRLWADRETGLLLKAALLDEMGKPIELYQFARVRIGGEVSAEMLEPVTAKSDLAWFGDAAADPLASTASETGEGEFPSEWVIENVPAGFTLTRRIRRAVPMRSKMVEHYVYSDGLASISVFVEDVAESDSEWVTGMSNMGAVHAFGHKINDHQITVVGEVPARTVKSIGMSVKAKQP